MSERVGLTVKKPDVNRDNSDSRMRRTDYPRSVNTSVDRILFLQRTVGNQAVQRLLRSGALQTKLRIGQPGDVYEQEADRVAEQVMRMPEPEMQRQVEPEEEEEILKTKPLIDQITPLVQRQVEEEEEEEMLQAKSRDDSTSEVSNDLESQINAIKGGGRPLAESERAYFEPRFGVDFNRVRVHTDTRAAYSARSVNAKAYTIGKSIVFQEGQYAPGTSEGRRLLAHELTHVVQQGNISRTINRMNHSNTIKEAVQLKTNEQIIFRRVASRLVNCTAGTNSAPANPVNTLTTLDAIAGIYSSLVSSFLAAESALISAGTPPNPASNIQQAYRNRFGLPPARTGGFLNRLTGIVRPTQNQVISEEMRLLSRRFGIIARMFSQWIHYRCIGGASTFAGCSITNCNAFAWACGGIGAIFLCPMFWTSGGITQQQQAGILIHEAAHINWTAIVHGVSGPGGNFRHAECYASFIADIMGFNSPVAPCPAPPP